MKLGAGTSPCGEGMPAGNQADVYPDLLHAPGCRVCRPRSPPRGGGGQGYGVEPRFSLDTRFAQGGELAASPAAPEELREARPSSDTDQQKTPIYTR